MKYTLAFALKDSSMEIGETLMTHGENTCTEMDLDGISYRMTGLAHTLFLILQKKIRMARIYFPCPGNTFCA